MAKNGEEAVFAEERKRMIVDLVNRDIKTTVHELCERFGVSPATIRNDLRELQDAGLLKRTHGGAISNKRANYEPNVYQREVEQIAEKRAIARAALNYVREGDTIALDTGTTAFEFAKLLTDYRKLTVVTNDLQIAAFLERSGSADIIIAGGAVRRNFHCTTGEKAIETLEDLNVDKTFLMANAVSLKRGVSTPNFDTANVKRALAAMGDEIILLCDHTKFGNDTFVRFARLKDMDVVITDSGIDPDYLDLLVSNNIYVDVAPA